MAYNYEIQSKTINLSTGNMIVVGFVGPTGGTGPTGGPYTVTIPMSQVEAEPNVIGVESLISSALLVPYTLQQNLQSISSTLPTSFTV
jgi:hypothetical protein